MKNEDHISNHNKDLNLYHIQKCIRKSPASKAKKTHVDDDEGFNTTKELLGV